MATEYDPPTRPTLLPVQRPLDDSPAGTQLNPADEFSDDLDAYLSATSKKDGLHEPHQDNRDHQNWSEWTLDPETAYYYSVEKRLCYHWNGTAWAHLDYDSVYGNKQQERNTEGEKINEDGEVVPEDEVDSPICEPAMGDQYSIIHPAPQGFTPTADNRYSYNPLRDVWHEAQTNTFSRFDADSQTYIPIKQPETIANVEAPPTSNEPGSDDTLRLLVVESKVLSPGSLVLVDANGLSMGRDRSWDKRLRLPEMETSKFHCQIYLDTVVVVTPPVETTDEKVAEISAQADVDDGEHEATAVRSTVETAMPESEKETIDITGADTPSPSVTSLSSNTPVPTTTTCFFITDVGSQNGTFLNTHRLSDPKCSSSPHPLRHLDIISVGSTTFEVHQHASGWPCERCRAREENVVDVDEDRTTKVVAVVEPELPINNVMAAAGLSQREILEIRRREELRRMKRKYGASSSSATTTTVDDDLMHRPHNTSSKSSASSSTTTSYIDRAKLRRRNHPDNSPHLSNRSPTPEPPFVISATTETRIGADNVGNRMLQRMGWREGSGLGQKGREGRVDPVAASVNEARAGLGAEKKHQTNDALFNLPGFRAADNYLARLEAWFSSSVICQR
ncbi:hypothetical protein BC936DRAFT_149010 [Jimgerdemannia flammicorona]|uniref:G-patch domain-containing protein n=1 Tax=Jimgerdemannia flammicorona TaxID=994334 RepID=A0A433DK60_9FUNG|nr:hypothetical protein BC936DRAFT_149010 [Jimgerdemannia flammicorona]